MKHLSKSETNHASIQGIFVLCLLAVFAGISVLLVTLSARTYRNTVTLAETHNNQRVISAIVRSAVWAEDGVSEVLVEKWQDTPILAIRSVYDDEVYIKRLYCRDGQLWESFTSEEYGFDGESGESICEAASFVPEMKDGCLVVTARNKDGSATETVVALRSGNP